MLLIYCLPWLQAATCQWVVTPLQQFICYQARHSTNTSTHFRHCSWPFCAATWRNVSPFLDTSDAPLPIAACKHSKWPDMAARCPVKGTTLVQSVHTLGSAAPDDDVDPVRPSLDSDILPAEQKAITDKHVLPPVLTNSFELSYSLLPAAIACASVRKSYCNRKATPGGIRLGNLLGKFFRLNDSRVGPRRSCICITRLGIRKGNSLDDSLDRSLSEDENAGATCPNLGQL